MSEKQGSEVRVAIPLPDKSNVNKVLILVVETAKPDNPRLSSMRPPFAKSSITILNAVMSDVVLHEVKMVEAVIFEAKDCICSTYQVSHQVPDDKKA